jgi:hypothetical protein
MATRSLQCTIVLVTLALASACSYPTMPASSAGGATAFGTPNTASILGALTGPHGEAAADVVVSIAGSTSVTRSDSTGHFGLSRIMPGDLLLKFVGKDVNASLLLPDVAPTERIDLTIALIGTTATIRESSRLP